MSGAAGEGGLLGGFLWGLLLGLLFVLAPALWLGGEGMLELALFMHPQWLQLRELATGNLQGSLLPFALALAAYAWQLRSLERELRRAPPRPERVARCDQLLDLCASLFFGIGVIWTAVGMRSALMHGLGEPDLAAGEDAFSVLQRLVEGGILTALSTTIVGGVGGYLMRVVKSVWLGQRLTALYLEASLRPLAENTRVLERIESLLVAAHADGGGAAE